MAGKSEQQVQGEAGAWWNEPGEGYWRALLDQGEVVLEPAPPADAQEVFRHLATHWEAESTPRAGLGQESGVWELARAALQQHSPFSVPVVGANRGGLVVEWKGVQGFVPASHLKEMLPTCPPQDRAPKLSRRIGETLTLWLIEVDEEEHRLVFSERTPAAGSGPSRALIESLRPGDVCQGRILNITAFGAFVDLGGIEGLVHISEISWDRLGHPADLLHTGDEVQVQVVGVNPGEGRVALSLKRLRPDPWSDVDSRYRVGQIVEGDVTSVVSFGAFVRLEEGLEGLIHSSELAEGGVVHPGSVVREGSRVRVRVLSIEAQKHRLALSLRQARDGLQLAG